MDEIESTVQCPIEAKHLTAAAVSGYSHAPSELIKVIYGFVSCYIVGEEELEYQ
jgi:hypothetical protein